MQSQITQSIDFPVTTLANTYLMKLPPQLGVTEAVSMLAAFQTLIQEIPSEGQIILDFGKTTFLDSSGIGALVGCLQLAQSKNIPLSLWSLQDQVKMIFSLTHMDKRFSITPHTEGLSLSDLQPSTRQLPLTHPSVRCRTKRLIDIVGALVGLGVTSILFVPIAVAIRLNSPGPILFSQIRCGWMGRRFRIWKFRSMVTNAEALKSQVQNEMTGPIFKNDRDPRITSVGRFLRRTSLDEFPQFWNVLIGDMSLIGTRPPTPEELDQYEIPSWQRLDVKPGMSGEWQVNGRSSIRNFEDIIQLDLKYQQNWSLTYDLKLIMKTFGVLLLKDRGAV